MTRQGPMRFLCMTEFYYYFISSKRVKIELFIYSFSCMILLPYYQIIFYIHSLRKIILTLLAIICIIMITITLCHPMSKIFVVLKLIISSVIVVNFSIGFDGLLNFRETPVLYCPWPHTLE